MRGLYVRAEAALDGRDWIAGFRSYADPYLTLRRACRTGVDLAGFTRLAAFGARMDSDSDVQAVLAAEGLT